MQHIRSLVMLCPFAVGNLWSEKIMTKTSGLCLTITTHQPVRTFASANRTDQSYLIWIGSGPGDTRETIHNLDIFRQLICMEHCHDRVLAVAIQPQTHFDELHNLNTERFLQVQQPASDKDFDTIVARLKLPPARPRTPVERILAIGAREASSAN